MKNFHCWWCPANTEQWNLSPAAIGIAEASTFTPDLHIRKSFSFFSQGKDPAKA